MTTARIAGMRKTCMHFYPTIFVQIINRKDMRRGEIIAASIGITLIVVMGSLIVYFLFNFDEIRQEQLYQTIQQLNAR